MPLGHFLRVVVLLLKFCFLHGFLEIQVGLWSYPHFFPFRGYYLSSSHSTWFLHCKSSSGRFSCIPSGFTLTLHLSLALDVTFLLPPVECWGLQVPSIWFYVVLEIEPSPSLQV